MENKLKDFTINILKAKKVRPSIKHDYNDRKMYNHFDKSKINPNDNDCNNFDKSKINPNDNGCNNFDKSKIIAWLEKYQISKYQLVPDELYGYVVDVNGDVDLSNWNMEFIPVKFNIVKGYFDCSYNQLSDLEFSPKTIWLGFDCSNNKLTSLKNCPKFISGVFSVKDNQIKNLEFIPEIVTDYFLCDNNPDLKEIQKIKDFKAIKKIHLELKVLAEKEKLEENINLKSLQHRNNLKL